MPECGLDECGISCDAGCACMSAAGDCDCWCEEKKLTEFKWLRGKDRADPEMIVNFTATEMPFTRLAEMFEFLFPDQILIPASKASAKVTTGEAIRQIKLRDLIERLGLLPAQNPLVGRALAEYKRQQGA